jgi:hypothetical protein
MGPILSQVYQSEVLEDFQPLASSDSKSWVPRLVPRSGRFLFVQIRRFSAVSADVTEEQENLRTW